MKKRILSSELIGRDDMEPFFRFMGVLPNPDKILRNTGKTIEAYRDLKNDAHVWSCIQSRKSGLLSLAYTIVPNGAPDSVAREIGEILNDLDISGLERDILEAPLFGYQPLEIMWKLTGIGRKYIIPSEILAKPQEWFFFDPNGCLRYKTPGNTKGAEPPPMKIINPVYESSYINPYGHSLLSKCYWPVTFKNGGIKLWVKFTEKYGMPFLMGQYTRGATTEEIQKLVEELADMSEDSVIVTPSDIKMDMHEAVRTTSVELYRELIGHCNSEISKAILSQTLTTEMEIGSYAAAQTHYRVRREVIQSDTRLVEWTMNKLISFITSLNFGASPVPKFNLVINDADNTQMIDRDIKIAGTGNISFSKKYWMDTYGFREDDIDVSHGSIQEN